MSRVIAVVNQSAGVAKTTSVASLASAFAQLHERVLVVDLDPQAWLTRIWGIDVETISQSIQDVLLKTAALSDVVINVAQGLDVVPASIELAAVEPQLMTRPGREFVVREALKPVLSEYDWVLIDASPSLGILTLNALTSADDVLVPVHIDNVSHRAMKHLLANIHEVQQFTNPDVRLLGALPVFYDGNQEQHRLQLEQITSEYGLRMWPPVPRSHRFREFEGKAHSLVETDPQSPSAEAYREIARSLLMTQ
jgi:chromosome partitioning protein